MLCQRIQSISLFEADSFCCMLLMVCFMIRKVKMDAKHVGQRARANRCSRAAVTTHRTSVQSNQLCFLLTIMCLLPLQAAPAQKPQQAPSSQVVAMQPDPASSSSASRTQAVGMASHLRTAAFRLLLLGCRSSGAAFIKWGQWSATREDIFPAESSGLAFVLHSCQRSGPSFWTVAVSWHELCTVAAGLP